MRNLRSGKARHVPKRDARAALLASVPLATTFTSLNLNSYNRDRALLRILACAILATLFTPEKTDWIKRLKR